MKKYLIINVSDPRWNNFVSKAIYFDFYHTQSYHLLEQENKSILFVYKFADNFIAIPLIIRPIPDSAFCDCTSVYGYCGPISNINFKDLPLKEIQQFNKELLSFFVEKKIISAFSRLHPLFPYQEVIFRDFGEVLTLNKTVAIDLNIPLDVQWYNYRKSTRVHIKKAVEMGITVRQTSETKDIYKFIEIYYENMQRISAKPYYYFSHEYFHKLMNSPDFKSVLLVAELNGKMVAGAIMVICNGIMQYHVTGTKNDMLIYSPMKLLFDSARLYAYEMKCKFCHLGGGYGGIDDSLFNFKANFSKDYFDFKVWRKIINKSNYNELVSKKFGDNIPASDYFPLYRSGLDSSYTKKKTVISECQ